MVAIHQGMILYKGERVYLERRIKDMGLTQQSILRDFAKAVDIITGRAMAAAIGHVITTGEPLDDAVLRLKELIQNGTLNQTVEPLMENSTLPDWVEKMVEVAELKGYNLTLDFEELEIRPWDSWRLKIQTKLWINLTDKFGIANLSRRFDVEQLVSIEGQEDPLYPLHTWGRAVNVFHRTPYEGNYTVRLVNGSGANWTYGKSFVCVDPAVVDEIPTKSEKILVINFSISSDLANQFLGVISETDLPNDIEVPYLEYASGATVKIPNTTYILLNGEGDAAWYIENLKEHITNALYGPSSYGASFLDRLEGKLLVQDKYATLSPNVIGLESFVDKDYLATLELVVRVNQTNIDYLYFNTTDLWGWRIKGIDVAIRIDNETSLGTTHHIVYGVLELVY
jgi:hypothetical protein